MKATLRHNAAAVVLYHNHPSGLSEQSAADELVTRRLREALALIDVRVLDHLIIDAIAVGISTLGAAALNVNQTAERE